METTQTRNAGKGSAPDVLNPRPSTPPRLSQSNRLATPALILASIAALATIVCSVIVGMGLGPLQARDLAGEALAQDSAMLSVYYGLLFSNILWTIIGITGLILGIVAARREPGRSRAVAAIIVAAAAPIVSFTIWLVLTLFTSPIA